jgi:hypothetical protein
MKTIVAFIVGLLIATAAWAQIDKASGTVWLPGSGGTLNGRHNYQMGLRPDGVVVWRWSPYHWKRLTTCCSIAAVHTVLWFAFTMKLAMWSKRTSTRAISKSGDLCVLYDARRSVIEYLARW